MLELRLAPGGGQAIRLTNKALSLEPTDRDAIAQWARMLHQHAATPEVTAQAETWRQVSESATTTVFPALRPDVDTFATAGQLSVNLDDADTVRALLGEVPAAFHAGINDILLIAFALAVTEFAGTGGAPIGIDVEGHGRHEELGRVDLSRTVGTSCPGARWPPATPRWAR